MADQEIRATHQEVEGFVAKLKDFHNSLGESEQAMLVTILESAQGAETGAYGWRVPADSGGGPKPWEDLTGWIEEQGDEDTQGFSLRVRIG